MLLSRKQLVIQSIGAAGVCSLLAASQARAGYTTINPPQYSNEASVQQILEHTYGQSLTASGNNYFGTSISAIRIEDTPDLVFTQNVAPVDMSDGVVSDTPRVTGKSNIAISPSVTDEFWNAAGGIASAHALYSAVDEAFGYFNGTSGGTYHSILTVTGGWGYDINTSDHSFTTGGDFRFGRDGTNGMFSSNEADNSDGQDHMVTYEIVDSNPDITVNGTHTYVLFFEDRALTQGNADFDFNDMAIEVTLTDQQAIAAPEPVTLSVAGAAFGGLSLVRRSRRRRVSH